MTKKVDHYNIVDSWMDEQKVRKKKNESDPNVRLLYMVGIIVLVLVIVWFLIILFNQPNQKVKNKELPSLLDPRYRIKSITDKPRKTPMIKIR